MKRGALRKIVIVQIQRAKPSIGLRAFVALRAYFEGQEGFESIFSDGDNTIVAYEAALRECGIQVEDFSRSAP